MQRIQAEAERNPERHRQLTAVRYYLQFIIWNISHDWRQAVLRHGTNYHTLLDQIHHYRTAGDAVALVTFNYDTLLEDGLSAVGVGIDAMSDYIARDYKVFKLHGSVNWAHRIKSLPIAVPQPYLWDVLKVIISQGSQLAVDRQIQLIRGHLLGNEDQDLYPAIAIPLEEKAEYECPSEHVDMLRQLLPGVSRILTVGWRATEAPFLKMLADHLPRQVRGLVVCGTENGASTTAKNLQGAGIDTSNFHTGPLGFSNFVLGDDIREFLR